MNEENIQPAQRFCTKCGSPVFDGQVFCPNCGNKVLQPEQTWGQPVPEQPGQTWGQPVPEQPGQTWGQPVPEQPEQTWGQSVPEQSQQAWGQPVSPQEELPKIELPEEEQPQVVPTFEEPVQSENFEEAQQAWQQPVQDPYGQIYQQQTFYGQQQTAGGQQAQGQPSYDPNMNVQTPTNVPMDPKKKKKTIILFSCLGAGLLLLIIGAILLINHFSYTRIDASKIYKVTYEGVNGKGRAVITLDEYNEEILAAYQDALEDLDLDKSYAIRSISFNADPYENLSNGDKIKVTVDYDEEEFNQYKIKLTNTTFEIKVEGLQDADDYDLFKDIKVNFEGVSGFGNATIDTSNCDSFASVYVYYDFEEYPSNLKNGDTVKVVANVDKEILYDNGYTTEVFEKEYVVEGLQEPQAYDIFKDIKLVYEGVSPYITVNVDTSACEQTIKDYVYFFITDNSNKKNGDTVIVEAQVDVDYLRSLGYEITETTKTYTIEDQGELINEVDAASVSQMDQALAAYIANWMTENGEDYLFDKDIKVLYGDLYAVAESKNEITNRYFATKADGDPYNTYAIINTCSYTIVNTETGDTTSGKYFILCTLDNVTKKPDGTCTFTEPEIYLGYDGISEAIDKLNESGYSYSEVKVQ